jgi:hypothetical protein
VLSPTWGTFTRKVYIRNKVPGIPGSPAKGLIALLRISLALRYLLEVSDRRRGSRYTAEIKIDGGAPDSLFAASAASLR